jgi:membrane protease YdiL (CAAX protease family)
MIRLSEQHRATLRWVFLGPNGIRAGWSIAIFLLVIGIGGGLLNLIGHALHVKKTEGDVRPIRLMIAELVSIALVLGAGIVMARIEKRSLWSYGLTGRHRLTNFVLGAAGGLASLSLVVGALYAGGYLVFDGVLLHGIDIPAYALTWLFIFFLVGFAEETIFRGYLQTTLTRGMGFWPGATLMSLLFAAAHIHNKGENILGIAQVFTAGMVLCLMLRVTGSLWMSIGFHTTWDWAQSYLYGTPDSAMMMQGRLLATHAVGNIQISGGTAGPEGSVLAPVGLIIGPLVLVWLGRRLGVFEAQEVRPGGSAPWTPVGAVGPQTPIV